MTVILFNRLFVKKFILIDGAGLVYRSFYAIQAKLTDSFGSPTNAVLGFTNILLNIIASQKPDYIAVAFDKKGPTFRHEAFKEYKATRIKAPQELYDQIPKVKEVIRAFQIPVVEADGYEADDVIATLAKQAEKSDVEILVATGDFDIFQIVDIKTKILYPEKGFKESVVFGDEEVVAKYGIKPSQVPDYKGLCGDSSDNIPGVYGIGDKTAKILIEKHGSLEELYRHLDEVPENVRRKLEAGRESAFFSKELATLVCDVPLNVSLKDCGKKGFDPQKIIPVLERFGFKKIIERLRPLFPKEQESLF